MMRNLAAIVAGTLAIAAPAQLPVQPHAAPARKVYVDRANGVSFAYPAGWLLNDDDDAATAKLRITTEASPNAVVQLEGNFAESGPYKETDFESAAFAYIVRPGGTEDACFAVVDHAAEAPQTPVTALWNGLHARRLDATFVVAGTKDIHQIAAAFRNDRCYLFEFVYIRRAADTVDKPLPAAQWTRLERTFAAVFNSVRVQPAPPRPTAPDR